MRANERSSVSSMRVTSVPTTRGSRRPRTIIESSSRMRSATRADRLTSRLMILVLFGVELQVLDATANARAAQAERDHLGRAVGQDGVRKVRRDGGDLL